MIYLGDYIGHIISELTMSRAQADGETIHLAELYASHNMLKHFPVPRLRLQETHLDIPVLVVNTEDSTGDAGPRGGPSPADTAMVFDSVVAEQLKPLKLTESKQNQIRGALARKYQLLEKRQAMGLDAGGLADHLTDALERELKVMKVSSKDLQKVMPTILTEAREKLQLKAVSPARLIVGVKTSELKDANPDSILRISMKLVEEAVEWSVIDQEKGTSILTPE